mmetsp:Transcript_62951/g.150087  ORF Transcript_62951/g.150087 Transcript_62951/m.150087 type:complete len:226 (-) Transcript_62951:1866-2543(-)
MNASLRSNLVCFRESRTPFASRILVMPISLSTSRDSSTAFSPPASANASSTSPSSISHSGISPTSSYGSRSWRPSRISARTDSSFMPSISLESGAQARMAPPSPMHPNPYSDAARAFTRSRRSAGEIFSRRSNRCCADMYASPDSTQSIRCESFSSETSVSSFSASCWYCRSSVFVNLSSSVGARPNLTMRPSSSASALTARRQERASEETVIELSTQPSRGELR